jgi:hypothetical protein
MSVLYEETECLNEVLIYFVVGRAIRNENIRKHILRELLETVIM